MGKVKRLRKKYHVLCANSKKAETAASIQAKSQSNLSSLTYADLISNSKMNRKEDFELKSSCSISKSIRSALDGQSIAKKDKRRLRHELFLNKLETSSAVFSKMNTSTKKRSKSKTDEFNADFPLKMDVNNEEIHSNKDLSASTCNRLKWSKGALKRRNIQFVQDINLFKNLLKNSSLSKNPHKQIQDQTLSKLNKECLESQIS